MRRVVFALLLLAGLAPAEDFETAYKVYKTWIRRPSLHMRTLARERLAATGDLRALKVLATSYGRPEQPKDQVRYLIASIAAENFAERPFCGLFAQWRAKNGRPEDAWLWYQTLICELEGNGPGKLRELALDTSANVFLRAAALEALRFEYERDLLPFVEEAARFTPPSGVPRAVFLESLTALLCNRPELSKKPEFRPPAEALMRRMVERATPDRSRLVMGRHFARFFKTRFVWRDGRRWLDELRFQQTGGKQATGIGYATFAGIEATGDRIAYVVDLSDSMLDPLSEGAMKRMPKEPPAGSAAARKRKEARSERWRKAFRRVKWNEVKNRFDAARELLKSSLLLLEDNQQFCVLWFGDKAGTLSSTRGLVKATLPNIRKTISELDSIRPGPKGGNRPHGTLKGNTNMHGGMLRAFRLRGGGAVGPGEYVNPATFTVGVDTIFLLSDGEPTWDDWPASDHADPGDHAGDPELGGRQQDSSTLTFAGPYRLTRHLIPDVRRLNLFRKAEIHCVGMGFANMSTLQAIAATGKGKTVDLTGR